MLNYKILENYIIGSNKVIKISELYSVDISLLSNNEYENYFYKLQSALNRITYEIQLSYINKPVLLSDYKANFSQLLENSSTEFKFQIARNFIHDIKTLIARCSLKSYKICTFLSISQNCVSGSIHSVRENIKKLEKQFIEIKLYFETSGFKLKELNQEEIYELYSNYL